MYNLQWHSEYLILYEICWLIIKLVQLCHFWLKCLYQVMKVSCHVICVLVVSILLHFMILIF